MTPANGSAPRASRPTACSPPSPMGPMSIRDDSFINLSSSRANILTWFLSVSLRKNCSLDWAYPVARSPPIHTPRIPGEQPLPCASKSHPTRTVSRPRGPVPPPTVVGQAILASHVLAAAALHDQAHAQGLALDRVQWKVGIARTEVGAANSGRRWQSTEFDGADNPRASPGTTAPALGARGGHLVTRSVRQDRSGTRQGLDLSFAMMMLFTGSCRSMIRIELRTG